MNPIGLHIGYWWGTGEEHDIFNMLELTHRALLDIMEINPAWLLKLTDAECAELVKRTRSYGMTLTLNGGLDSTNDISADSEKIREKGIAFCTEVLEKMPRLEMSVWSGLNYSAWLRAPQPEGDFLAEKERAKAYAVQSLQRILKVAERVGADYCFEVVNRYEQFLFNTAREAVEFTKKIGSPKARVHLDTYHMNIEEDNMAQAIVYAGKSGLLGHFHVGESNRRVPGAGDTNMDWVTIGKALKAADYNGAVVMEPFILPAAFNARRTKTWRDLSENAGVDRLVEDARRGGMFLREVLR